MVNEVESVRILDLAAVLLRRWKVVAGAVILALAAQVAWLVLMPSTYTARAVLVQPPDKSGGSGMQLPSSLSGGAALFGVAGGSPDTRLVSAILESQTLRDSVVNEVMRGKQNPALENEIWSILQDHADLQYDDVNRVLQIKVDATDAALATRIANAFLPAINSIAANLTVSTATRRQEYLAGQLASARENLVRSENRLLDFQREHNVADVPEQATRTVDAATELQAAINQKEVEVLQLRRTSTPENPLLRSAEAELNTLRGQLRDLTSGGNTSAQDVFLALKNAPDLKAAATRLLRDYGRDEQVYVALTAALTSAQMDVSNNAPVLAALDPAMTPLVPEGNIAKDLALAAVVGILAGLILVTASELLAQARRDPRNAGFFAEWDGRVGMLTGLARVRGRSGARSTVQG